MTLTRISFIKVQDMIMVSEEVWEELIECYLSSHPDLRGHVGYDDPDFREKAMGLLQLMYGQTQGSA